MLTSATIDLAESTGAARRRLIGVTTLATLAALFADGLAAQARPGAQDRPCPTSAADTAGWPRFTAGDSSFALRLPPGTQAHVTHGTKVLSTSWHAPQWSIIAMRDPEPWPAAAPTDAEERVTCVDRLGSHLAQFATYRARSGRLAGSYGTIVSWQLGRGQWLNIIGMSQNRQARDELLAALRTVRILK